MCSTDVQVCQVVIEDVNADGLWCAVRQARVRKTRPELPASIRTTKSSPAICRRRFLAQDDDGIASHHRPHDRMPQAVTTR